MSGGGPVTRLRMPKWGLSMTQGTVVRWIAPEGGEVAAGDEVVEVESEKINNAVEAPGSGVLRRRVAQEGDLVPVGGLLAVIAEPAVPDEEIDAVVEQFQTAFVPEREEAAGPEPEVAEVAGRRLQYLRAGEDAAEPLLLLPGFGGDLGNFLFNQEELSRDRTVYALDLPGQGGSSKDVGSGDLAFFVAAVTGLMDRLGIERAHLAGHSMGGLIAAGVALEQPRRVASLSLIASAGLGEEINGDYLEGFVAASRRRDMQGVLALLFADPALVTRQLVEDVLRLKRLDGVEEALRAVQSSLFPGGRQATILDLEPLQIPILAVWGAEDRIIPAAHAGHLPAGARVEVLAGAGHMPHMEEAGRVNRILAEWLQRAAR